jgi:hypothetical protein
LVVSCNFEYSQQDTPWAEYDNKNRPSGDFDFFCAVVAMVLRPGVKPEEVLSEVRRPRAHDPNFAIDFMKARTFKKAEWEFLKDKPIKPFHPGSSVATATAGGHEIYEKALLVTEGQFQELVKKTPKQLKKTPWAATPDATDATRDLYIISRAGITKDSASSAAVGSRPR